MDVQIPAPTGGSPEGGRSTLIQVVIWVGWAFATTFVLLRVYAKFTIIKITGWSLVWALAAYIIGTAANVLVSVSATYGMGNHTEAILETGGPSSLISALQFFWLGASLATLATGFSKVAGCAFLLEIQSRKHKIGRAFLWFLATTNFIFDFIGFFIVLFQCNPPQKAWNPTVPGDCTIQSSGAGLDITYFYTAWNAATDLCITLYPFTIIRYLNVSFRMKITLSLIMSVGFFAFAAAVCKGVELRHFHDRSDLTYAFTPTALWDGTDLWVFIFVTSIPPLWPFFRFYFARTAARLQGRDVDEAGAGAIQMSLYKGDRFKGNGGLETGEGGSLKRQTSNESDSYSYFMPRDGIIMTTEVMVDKEARRKSSYRRSRMLKRNPFSTESAIAAGMGVGLGGGGTKNTTKTEFVGEAVKE